MKKILLIGDSIRMGYDRYVKESMVNVAEVYYPAENCKFTANILRDLHNWTAELNVFEADAVHWNAGLWDTLRIYGDDMLTKPETYADNIKRICERISYLFPDAKQIFATSTPVMENAYIKDFEMRYNADIERYNDIARRVLEEYGVVINDLYGLLKDCHEQHHSDQTHYYTASGTLLIGNRVNDVLCDTLGIDKSLLVLPDIRTFELNTALPDTEMFEKVGRVYVMKKMES